VSEPIKGVAFNAPPMQLVGDIRSSIDQAVAQLPADKRGALVGVATEQGVNAAIVAKLDHGWTVQSWIGKAWGGAVQGGAQVMKAW
jgi:hypothetical protein